MLKRRRSKLGALWSTTEQHATDCDSTASGTCADNTFTVSVSSLAGEALTIRGLLPSQSLQELYSTIAKAKDLRPHELQLCAGSRCFQVEDLGVGLRDLGLTEGASLTFARRPLVHLTDVGVSRYDSAYFCTVLGVEEVGFETLEVEFEIVGNMSLGRIQDPAASTLRWQDRGTGQTVRREPASYRYTRHDLTSHVRGALVYESVPTAGQVSFVFGRRGYSPILVQLSDEE